MSINRRKFLKYGLYGAGGALLPGIYLNGCSRKGPVVSNPARPNVVVILCDTLRFDFLGFNGMFSGTSPFLTELSKKSVNFMRAFSTSSWTAPSTTSLLTSMYPHRHGVIEGLLRFKRRMEDLNKDVPIEGNINSIPSDIPVMQEFFQSMGYATFGVAANRNIGSEIGFDRGFDRFELMVKYPWGYSASDLYKQAKVWVHEVSGSKPIFLYMHLNDVHGPYEKHKKHYKKPAEEKFEERAKYISEIGYLDSCLKKIYDFMGAESDTIFVVVSDHGEEFGEHGGTGHSPTLYRELTQVITMFHAPFLGLKPGSVDVNVSLIDVLPTILDLLEFKNVGALEALEGVSLKPILRADAKAESLRKSLEERTIFAHRINRDPNIHFWAAIHQHWNMVESPDGNKVLFDHRTDLPEQNDVFSDHPRVTEQLVAKLENFKSVGKRLNVERSPVIMDEELIRTLESLGYVDKD